MSGSEHAYGYRNKLTPHHDKPKLVTTTHIHIHTLSMHPPFTPEISNPDMADASPVSGVLLGGVA